MRLRGVASEPIGITALVTEDSLVTRSSVRRVLTKVPFIGDFRQGVR